MPNHVTHRMHVAGDSAEARRFFAAIAGENGDLIDFGKIVPMPKVAAEAIGVINGLGVRGIPGLNIDAEYAARALKGETPDHITLERMKTWDDDTWAQFTRLCKCIVHTGRTSVLDWCCANWGTKWNAYQFSRESGPAQVGEVLVFDTAWSTPEPVFHALAKMLVEQFPSLVVSIDFASEDWESHAGTWTFKDGIATMTDPSEDNWKAFAYRAMYGERWEQVMQEHDEDTN